VREAAEALDDFEVQPRHVPIARASGDRRQRQQEVQPALLIGQRLAVFERQVEEHPPGRRHRLVEAAGERPVGRRQRQVVAGEGARCAAEDVARHLVEQHHMSEGGLGTVFPMRQRAGDRRLVVCGKA